MLPRKNRIPTEYFPQVTRGKTTQNDLFRVVTKNDTTLRFPRCAVIVPQSIAKTAVSRNLIRRQVYTLLGEILTKLPTAFISVFPKKVPMTQQELLCLKKLLSLQ